MRTAKTRIRNAFEINSQKSAQRPQESAIEDVSNLQSERKVQVVNEDESKTLQVP